MHIVNIQTIFQKPPSDAVSDGQEAHKYPSAGLTLREALSNGLFTSFVHCEPPRLDKAANKPSNLNADR